MSICKVSLGDLVVLSDCDHLFLCLVQLRDVLFEIVAEVVAFLLEFGALLLLAVDFLIFGLALFLELVEFELEVALLLVCFHDLLVLLLDHRLRLFEFKFQVIFLLICCFELFLEVINLIAQ